MSTARSRKTYPYPAEFVWRFVKDFFTPWHPRMSWCEQVDDHTRKFGMVGEDTVYVERLTVFDEAERRFEYEMLEGISGIEQYRGRVFVFPLVDNRAQIIWDAKISGPEAVTKRVAQGTEAVFQAGLDELAELMKAVTTAQTEWIPGSPKLAVDVAGEGDLVLFLHGIGGNRTNWHEQLSALATSFKTAALDFRGYGLSQLGNDAVTAQRLVDDIRRTLDYFDVQSAHLVGLSYGSWIAACFGQLHPKRVASITFCAGSSGMSEASEAEKGRFKALRLTPMEAGQTPADIASAVVDALSGPEATPESRARLLASMKMIPRETYVAALRCFLNPPFKINFEGFDFPTTFIAGEHDRLASPEEMGSVAQRVPNGKLYVVPRVGHLINVENPRRFTLLLLASLTGKQRPVNS
ncbi:MAG: alpha/beta fold hydrolase [Chloroflexota bacterium]